MEIKRNGFVYRVSYLTTSKWDMPDQVSACSLIWRFPLFFCLWILAVLVTWIVSELVTLVIVPAVFLVGKRLKLNLKQEAVARDMCDALILPGTNLFTRVSFLSYDVVPIQNRVLKWIGPTILAVGFLSFIIRVCVRVCVVIIQLVGPDVVEFIGRTWGDSWWTLAGAASPILLVLVIFFGGRAYRAVATSELGQLVSTYYKAKKEKFCPVIKVV